MVMPEADIFKDQKKIRRAEYITPPNVIKRKVGSGGIDPEIIVKAQQNLEENTVDFKPIATELIAALDKGLQDTTNGAIKGEAAIEAMLYPAMQLKAQGAMFHFPLVSEISDILVSFLETVTIPPSESALEIVDAHKLAIGVVISSNMTGRPTMQGQELKTSLMEACIRYYKTQKV